MLRMKSRQPRASGSKSYGVGASGSAREGTTPPANVDEYLAATPEPARAMLIKMRAAIRSALPTEAIEVISYRMPAFKLQKVLVWFAAFRDHCSFFPTAAVVEHFSAELVQYKTSKGTVQFTLDKPLPMALVKRLVKARLELAGYRKPPKSKPAELANRPAKR